MSRVMSASLQALKETLGWSTESVTIGNMILTSTLSVRFGCAPVRVAEHDLPLLQGLEKLFASPTSFATVLELPWGSVKDLVYAVEEYLFYRYGLVGGLAPVVAGHV